MLTKPPFRVHEDKTCTRNAVFVYMKNNHVHEDADNDL
jgi:hypothetical protein